jgi:hypothetical protein
VIATNTFQGGISMAQVLAAKQASFLNRFDNAILNLMAAADALSLLQAESTNNGYATGGGDALTDTIVQVTLPASTAAQFNTALSSVVAVQTAVANNRQAFEALRP